MLTKNIFAAGAFLSVAAAIPMQQNKRDVVWETQIEHATVTMDVTTTIWLNPGETAPAAAASGVSPAHFGHHHHPHPPQQPDTTSTAAAAPSPPPAYTQETSPAAAPTTAPAAAPTTYAAPSPATTSEAPAYSPPAYSPPAASPSSAPSSGGSSGGEYTGDLTYYTPGLGSCGETSTDSESIVALAEGMMTAAQVGGNPNANPLCGKSITISYGGKTAVATIVDTCPGCSGGSLDLTPSLFEKFAPLSEGRLTGMTWSYNN